MVPRRGRKEGAGEGMRPQTQAIGLPGKGRLPAWQGDEEGSVLTVSPLPSSYPRAGL